MILIVSVAQGQGHGAEAVLEHLLRGWDPVAEPLTVLTPPRSRIERVCGECGIPMASLGSHDRLAANLGAVYRASRTVPGAALVHAWAARGFEAAALLGALRGIPASGTLHDHPHASFHGRVRRRLIRISANRMQGMAVVSSAVQAACAQHGFQVPVRVLPNGLTHAPLPAPRTRATPVRVGFLGLYAEWKGFDVVAPWIEATRTLPVEWRLYGDPAPSLSAAARALHDRFPDRVVLSGRRPAMEIFSTIDILVHASTEFDPFPTTLLEAGRAGIPAVASRLGGAGEIVIDGDTGYLFDPRTPGEGLGHLRTLLAEPALRRRMGDAARARFEAVYTVATMVDGYRRFWGELRGGKRPITGGRPGQAKR